MNRNKDKIFEEQRSLEI